MGSSSRPPSAQVRQSSVSGDMTKQPDVSAKATPAGKQFRSTPMSVGTGNQKPSTNAAPPMGEGVIAQSAAPQAAQPQRSNVAPPPAVPTQPPATTQSVTPVTAEIAAPSSVKSAPVTAEPASTTVSDPATSVSGAAESGAKTFKLNPEAKEWVPKAKLGNVGTAGVVTSQTTHSQAGNVKPPKTASVSVMEAKKQEVPISPAHASGTPIINSNHPQQPSYLTPAMYPSMPYMPGNHRIPKVLNDGQPVHSQPPAPFIPQLVPGPYMNGPPNGQHQPPQQQPGTMHPPTPPTSHPPPLSQPPPAIMPQNQPTSSQHIHHTNSQYHPGTGASYVYQVAPSGPPPQQPPLQQSPHAATASPVNNMQSYHYPPPPTPQQFPQPYYPPAMSASMTQPSQPGQYAAAGPSMVYFTPHVQGQYPYPVPAPLPGPIYHHVPGNFPQYPPPQP